MRNNVRNTYTAGALESVLRTHELATRPSRPPDYQTENHALLAIAQHMAGSPQTTLQKLVEVALEICRAGSAGVSLVSEKSGDFFWPAIAGAWKPNIGGGTPRHFGPCGVVLDRNAVQLFTRPERYYLYLAPVVPAIEEVLLTPFYVAGKAVGTVWVVSHDPDRKFDAEDLRLIESLGRLAATVYPLSAALDARAEQDQVMRDVNESLVLSSVRQHELTEQAQKAETVAHESEERLKSELTVTQRLQATSTQLIGEDNHAVLYEQILDAAVLILHSEFASLQILDSERDPSGELRLIGNRGFPPEAAQFWEWVRPSSASTCGIAVRTEKRVTVSDVRQCDFLTGSDDLEMYLKTGIHAVQSTPLISRGGKLLGMLSTHWQEPHQPEEHELQLLDVLARQAADFIERSQVQATLSRTEADLRNFIETAAIGLNWVGPDGIILWANDADFHSLGYTHEEYVGHPIAEFHLDGAVIEDILARLGRGETLSDYEARLRCKDGLIRYVLIDASVLFEDGKFLHTRTFTRDITERKHAEEALQESEVHFTELAESIPVIVWTADAKGWIDWYNSRWYEYTGQSRDDAAGWGWQNAHHPNDLPRVLEAWSQSIASGQPFEMEFRLRRHDGVFHHFMTRIRPSRNEHGEIVRWYGSNVDIQAHKTALERSQLVAETFQSILLPGALPHDDKVRFDASYSPAEKDSLVGGDWLEATHLPDGRYLISIGDVTGHGLNASIIAGRLRQAMTDFALTNDNPAVILSNANRILRFQHPDVYATALVGFLDRDCTRLIYASAGHPAPLLATSHTVPAKELPFGGVLLGFEDNLDLVSHSIDISAGNVLAFYTDGITEFARDMNSAETALRAAVAQVVDDTSIARPAVMIQKNVLGDAPPTDDIALLIVQFDAVDKAALPARPTEFTKTWRFHSNDTSAAHITRREVMDFIRHFSVDPEALFAAELILGEVLANTVYHAPGPVEVHIDWSREKPIVRVADTGPGLGLLLPEVPQDTSNEHGRGLFLINALADEVTITSPNGYGTEVRAVLPLVRNHTSTAVDASPVGD